jgi:hypothetical protein
MCVRRLENVPEFNSRRDHFSFQLTKSFQPHDGRGGDTAPNRNEYQESSRGGGVKSVWRVRRTALPPSVSRFIGKCGSLDFWQLCGPSRLVTGIALPLYILVCDVQDTGWFLSQLFFMGYLYVASSRSACELCELESRNESLSWSLLDGMVTLSVRYTANKLKHYDGI